MKKEVADLWIVALESGEYAQGIGALHQIKEEMLNDKVYPAGYCCLGVLCEIAIKNGLDVVKIETDVYKEAYDKTCDFLPVKVKDWAGMNTVTGEFDCPNDDPDDSDTAELTDLNDNGKTFKEIANIIRENWEKL